jgi:effector-binding domain-containing protein
MAITEVGIETVAAQPMAAVAARSDFAGLPKAIAGGLDKVYAVLRAGNYGPLGCNTVYYGPMASGVVMDLKIGVRLSAPYRGGDAEVIATETPAGDVAHAVYFGDYGKMRPAHDAARAEAGRHGRRLTGESWEVYGDWSDNPEKLRTDIYWRLQALGDD